MRLMVTLILTVMSVPMLMLTLLVMSMMVVMATVVGGCSSGQVDNDTDIKIDRSVESDDPYLYSNQSATHKLFNL